MKSLIISILLLHPLYGYACSCGWDGAFLKMADDPDALVVVGKVIEQILEESSDKDSEPIAMIVQVETVLKGNELKKEIIVYGDDGILCRPYTSEFPIGTEWAFILYPSDSDFIISMCGEFWLEKSGNNLLGTIKGSKPKKRKQSMSIETLTELLNANKT